MTQILDLLGAFMVHYGGLKYTEGQHAELCSRYRWMKEAYKNAIYDAVISSHPSALRSLPDVAVIEKAMQAAGRPETYETGQRQIEFGEVVSIGQVQEEVKKVKAMTGVANEQEVRRVGVKIAHGEATADERHWYWCMTENNGQWVKPEDNAAGLTKGDRV